MENQNKSVLFGLYNDEEVLMSAIEKANEQHYEVPAAFYKMVLGRNLLAEILDVLSRTRK